MMIRALLLTFALSAAVTGCTLYDDGSAGGPPSDVYYPDAGPAPIPPDGGGWGVPDAQPWPPFPDGGGWPPPDGGIVINDGGTPPPHDGGSGCDCSAITTEAVCMVEPTCTALYTGVDCECYPDGTCDCLGFEFDRCE